MTLLVWIFLFSILGSIGAIAGAALMLLFPENTRKTLLPYLISYATGTLLGAAFLGMIPKALQHATPMAVSGTVLAGIVMFFVLEELVIWRHCHDENCEVHSTHDRCKSNFSEFSCFDEAFIKPLHIWIVPRSDNRRHMQRIRQVFTWRC